jgi:exodeoxyribonuclease VII small subunit
MHEILDIVLHKQPGLYHFPKTEFVLFYSITTNFTVFGNSYGGLALGRKNKQGNEFEKKLAELEEIVNRLESGKSTLEESLSLFEDGTGKLKELTGILEEAERKIEVLSSDASGKVVVEPFNKSGEDDEADQG